MILSNAQNWANTAFFDPEEICFLFQLRNIDKKIVDSYLENSWKHVVNSILVDVPEAELTVWIESLKPAWKADDYCRVQWSEDQVIYESQIKSIDSADGQR